MKTTPIYGWPYPDSADHTRTWEYWQSLALAIEPTVKANANSIAALTAKVPFAMAAGKVAIADRNPDQGGSVVVTYPAGRFTQAPVITVGTASVNSYAPAGTDGSTSTTSFIAKCYNPTTIAATGLVVHWTAVQMTSSSGPGRAEPAAETGPTVNATCHTAGCSNAGTAIPIADNPDVERVVCGVCSQTITDLAA